MTIKKMDQNEIVEKLLWPLWRSIDDEFKERYMRKIWDMYEQAIRSSSYTGNLKTFLANFQKKIPVTLRASYAKDIRNVVDSGQDFEILNWFRDETTYLVMIVRLINQERKENFIS